uniref:Nucleoside diphosphate kinase n=1 Tax=Denticeps clupeoides TaxID=299321 RepID=A0AAY4C455_9TELE
SARDMWRTAITWLPARRRGSGRPPRRFPAWRPGSERSFIAVKPDGVQRGLVGEVIKRFEQKGFRLVAMKFLQPSEDLTKEHYIDLKALPFYAGLVKFMSSGPVVAMVWEGQSIVKISRVMLGETNPADSKPGTIRGDLCIQIGRNIIHGSDSIESANKEINLWFKPEEMHLTIKRWLGVKTWCLDFYLFLNELIILILGLGQHLCWFEMGHSCIDGPFIAQM